MAKATRHISLTDAPATIVGVGIGRVSSDTVVRVVVDVSGHSAEMDKTAPGFAARTARMAVDEAPPEKCVLEGPRPELSIKLKSKGAAFVGMAQARLRGSPVLKISKNAERATLALVLEGSTNDAEWLELRRNCYADGVTLDASVITIAEQQQPTTTGNKPRGGRKPKKTKDKENVNVVDPRTITGGRGGDEAAAAMAASGGGEGGPIQ